MNIRFRIMVPLLLAMLTLAGAFIWSDLLRRQTEIQATHLKTVSTVEKLIASEIGASIQIMETSLDSLARDSNLISIFKSRQRDRLLEASKNIFSLMKEKNKISHFYYYRPNRTTLLRMHEPNHFDDLIERRTLLEAESSRLLTYGVEQGPTGASVLRVVFPIFLKDELIGYLELGKEIQDIVHKIELIVGLKTLVLAEKKVIKRHQWENRNNREAFSVSWDFLPDRVVMASTFATIPNELPRLQIDDHAASGYFVGDLQLQDESGAKLDVIVIPFFDMSRKKVADIVLLYDSSAVKLASDRSTLFNVAATFFIASVLLMFFYIFLGRVEDSYSRQQSVLVSSSKMASLGEMAGGIAHEINTPLGAIILNTQMLIEMNQESKAPDPDIEKRASTIIQIAHRIGKIVTGLKGFSREAKNDDYRIFAAREWVADTLNLCSEKLKNRGVKLVVGEDHMDVLLRGQIVALSQTLLNLLNNALDATKQIENPWIRIEGSLSIGVDGEKMFELSVTDSGAGVDPKYAEKIFQPFFTTKGFGEGTGLGLSISRGIVQSHQGELYLDRGSPHTRFVIRLPVAELNRRREDLLEKSAEQAFEKLNKHNKQNKQNNTEKQANKLNKINKINKIDVG